MLDFFAGISRSMRFSRITLAVLAVGLLACGEDTREAVSDVWTPDDVVADTPHPDLSPVLDVSRDLVGDLTRDPTPDTLPDAGEETLPAHGGVTAARDGALVRVDNGVLTLSFDLETGRLAVFGAGGRRLLSGAETRITYERAGAKHRAALSSPGDRSFAVDVFEDRLGEGLTLRVRHEPEDDAHELVLSLDLRGGATYLTARAEVHFPAGVAQDVRVQELSPLVADPESDGALFVGPDPGTHRVLDNGGDIYLDFVARVFRAGANVSIMFRPGIAANWSTAIHDPESGKSVVAGFFSADKGLGVIVSHYVAQQSVEDEGRASFTRFAGITHYQDGRGLAGGDDDPRALASELFYVDFLPDNVFEGLEQFAARYATRIGKQIVRDIPSGWNSWGGGFGSGGYGTHIDRELMLANLEAAARDFAPWGMRHFFLDDGWQPRDGEWVPNQDRFPDQNGRDGMAAFADEVYARGMIPGIWISPFNVTKDSEVARHHPDWLAEKGPLAVTVVPEEMEILDLSHPEVLDWLEGVFRRLTAEWGYRWIKMDFSYYALFATNLHDPDMTPSEAYRNAMRRIREAIGPETFLLSISATGLCLDDADGGRITLDNEPWWGDGETQGIKVTYPTYARRYYLNHHAWVNHPDLLFYRTSHGLTAEEARAWTSVVALTGGIVKLGDSYLALADHPEWREEVYRLLPVYPKSARPLDLFEREYPELWHLELARAGRRSDVVGMFNWGQNRDIGASDFEEEETRRVTLALERLGRDPTARYLVFDAWEESYAWVADGQLAADLEPRSARVFVAVEEPEEPAVVLTSRHLLGGAVEVANERFEAHKGTLTAEIATVAQVPVRVYVATAGRSFVAAEAVDAGAVTAHEADGVLTLSFTPGSPGTVLRVHFVPAHLAAWPQSCPTRPAAPGTLSAKTATLDQLVRDRHLDDGLLRSLQVDDDGEVVARHHLESTGLWTAMYLASQAFRYAVTGEEEAVENARIAVAGLSDLTGVTGIPGLYGRAYARPDVAYTRDVVGASGWVESPAPDYEGWWYRGDVSKDTMDGIMWGYVVALDLFDDHELRDQVRRLLLTFVERLVADDLQILDHTGEVTEHGRMFYSAWDDTPGFNAILTLSWLRVAASSEGDGPLLRFMDDCLLRRGDRGWCPDFDWLDIGSYLSAVEKYLILYQPACDTNYNNVHMVMQAIYMLLRFEQRPDLRERLLAILDVGIWRPADPATAPPLHRSTHSLYAYLYGGLMAPPHDDLDFVNALEDALCTLIGLPEDRRDRDLAAGTQEAVCLNRFGRPAAADPIPLEERRYDNYLWRFDPYEIPVARPAQPGFLHSPEDYLLAYWAGRHYGFIDPQL